MGKKRATFIIFGGTGDLTKRKLVPAFAGLVADGVIDKRSTIIGIGRRDQTDDSYRTLLVSSANTTVEKKVVSEANIKYYQRDSTVPGALAELESVIKSAEPKLGSERVFYLATSYTLFPKIIANLKSAGLDKTISIHKPKVVFEKPFGHNYESALALEKKIHAVFSEDQVYRIDHYLGKETVQNINILKFTNPFIKAIMNKDFVDYIDIFSDETLGVGERLGYYDGVGATKDMIQSHLLQVLSLVLMGEPKSFDGSGIHDAKAKVLKKIRILPKQYQIVGQYESLEAEFKAQDMEKSNTETFVRMGVECTSRRWRGVKCFLQSGKKLSKKSSKIIIYLKRPNDIVTSAFGGIEENKIIIDIQPDEDVKIYFNTRKPFSKNTVRTVPMDFCGACHFGTNTTDGYKVLLRDVLLDDKTLFTRYDELRYSWRIVDSFLAMKSSLMMHTYKDGASAFDVVKKCRLKQK